MEAVVVDTGTGPVVGTLVVVVAAVATATITITTTTTIGLPRRDDELRPRPPSLP